MAGKGVNFNVNCNLCDTQVEAVAKWLSCNGELWGVGPTAVFASAAALFLYNELEATIFMVGDHQHVSLLEKIMVSTMVLGMLALMIHLWVCSMRFFQYYLDTLIKDSPNMLLEMTTAGLLGGQEMVALGPLTKFLRQQQPQIHITVCWFLSLCYADYVRKHYCQRFNMPYLEQWQSELHERAARQARRVMEQAHSFVGSVHRRLRGFTQAPNADHHTVRAWLLNQRWKPARESATRPRGGGEAAMGASQPDQTQSLEAFLCASSDSLARLLWMLSRSSEIIFSQQGAYVANRRTSASPHLPLPPESRNLEDFPRRTMASLHFE